MWGSGGLARSKASPWVPISFPLTCMVYLLQFLSYLAGSKSVSVRPSPRPFDPDTMTNTTVEAIASLGGKNWRFTKDKGWESHTKFRIPEIRLMGARKGRYYASYVVWAARDQKCTENVGNELCFFYNYGKLLECWTSAR